MNSQHVNIVLRDLSVGYRKGKRFVAVKEGINLTATSGELIALVGSNGIGKSTLLRTLTSFQKPISGDVMLNGQPLQTFHIKDLAKILSFVSTEAIRVQNLRVCDLLAMGRYPYTNMMGTLTENDRQIIKRAIEQVGLVGYEERMIDQISDGERQRAMIARTLVQDTPLIILDEPTAFLDIRNKYEIIHLLHSLAKSENKTVLFSTHDLNISASEVDKIWLMLDDAVIEGAPEDLALAGHFDRMFRSEKVFFDSESGDFVLRKNTIANYSLIGAEGKINRWTNRALVRMGLVSTENNPLVKVFYKQTAGNIIWQIEIGERVKFECSTLYDLTNELNKFLK